MSKIAIVVLADTQGDDGVGRIVNALAAAREFKDGGDDVQVLFTGAGSKWVGELARPDHKLHEQFGAIREQIAGVCGFCAVAFGVADSVQSEGVCLLEEFGSNMSFRRLVNEGYRILSF